MPVIPASTPTVLLDDVDAFVFDLDGVLTDTAQLHERAWAQTFNSHLSALAPVGDPASARPFTQEDYRRLVDGELPATGVRHVLADRGIVLSDGSPDDPGGSRSVWALVNDKDERYRSLLAKEGPHRFDTSVALVRRLRSVGVDVAVVSASRHCAEVLEAAGLTELVDVRVDGAVARAMGLAGKPDPAMFLEAAQRLGVEPARAAVVEDALAGVEAGRAGGFAVVVGVDRSGQGEALRACGATIVVPDLGNLRLEGTGPSSSRWRLVYRDPAPADEGVVETLCTLANGYVGTRGARPWARDDGVSYPGTYLAGLYNRLDSQVGGSTVEVESLVNVPNWLPFTFRAGGGPWLGVSPAGQAAEQPWSARKTAPSGSPPRVESHLLRLDLRRGLLLRRCVVTDGAGQRTAVVERRLVSMADPHLVAQEITVVPIDWSGTLELAAGVEGGVAAAETEEERLLANRHLDLVDQGTNDTDCVWLRVRTSQSQVTVGIAMRAALSGGLAEPGGSFTVRARDGEGGSSWLTGTGRLSSGVRVTLEKVAALYTSHDRAISEPGLAARQAVVAAPSFGAMVDDHAKIWRQLWRRAAIEVGDASATSGTVLDLHLFHLLQVASPHLQDVDTGMGARGLHGEGYLGHVFWDSLFVYPVLAYRFPAIARQLLAYRSRRLPAARLAARAAGHAGAMFPWQSGSDGRDETPGILYNPRSGHWTSDRSRFQRHVGLAVGFCAWQHWQVTGDFEFLARAGAELMLEIARFFSSIAARDGADDRYHIGGVMGPDEFHDGYPWTDEPGVTDNAYTNVMTAWLLRRASDVVEMLVSAHRYEEIDRLSIDESEVAHWRDVSRRLAVPFHDGVISQFAGYERLEPFDLDAYRARYGNIGRLDLILEAEGDAVRRYQVGKQADVLMLFYILSAEELRAVFEQLGYSLEPELIRHTVDYYAQRVTHGSTLSSVVHAWVLARADRHASWRYFTQALSSDIADTQGGTTREGVHLGAMAGTADLLQRCYPGIETRGEALWFNPQLPAELRRLAFTTMFRGMLLEVELDHRRVRVRAQEGQAPPITVVLRGEPASMHPGQVLEAPVRDAGS